MTFSAKKASTHPKAKLPHCCGKKIQIQQKLHETLPNLPKLLKPLFLSTFCWVTSETHTLPQNLEKKTGKHLLCKHKDTSRNCYFNVNFRYSLASASASASASPAGAVVVVNSSGGPSSSCQTQTRVGPYVHVINGVLYKAPQKK